MIKHGRKKSLLFAQKKKLQMGRGVVNMCPVIRLQDATAPKGLVSYGIL
jgi:hypothetical protein